jgi:inorganic pyrophosphatase/exopolyphosphatase
MFYDAFRAAYKPETVKEVMLVDHNILDVRQGDLSSKVTRIIDHHVDANAYEGQLVEKVCRFVGSACSLVALKVAEDAELLKDDLAASDDAPNFAYLLGAAVVLDSYYFKEDLRDKKWSQEDSDAHAFL